MATTIQPTPARVRVPRWLVTLFVVSVAVSALLWVGVRTGICENHLSTWVELTITGLRLGCIYAMIALGYTMVYGVLELLNFAHSEVFMLGSFAGLYALNWIFHADRHVNGYGGFMLVLVLLVGMAVGAIVSGLVAVAMERVAYRPLRRRSGSRLAYLITAIGVSLFLSNFVLLLDGQRHLGLPFNWPALGGNGPVAFPNVMASRPAFTILGFTVDNLTILVMAVAVVMLVVLDLFVNRTRAGMGIRAVAEDPDTASLMGVDVNAIIVITFLVGGLMAGVAGVLYGLFFTQAQFNMGFIPGIKAFTAAVLGGIGNIRGAMLGGLLLGLIENLGVACINAQWQNVIAFVVLVGVLMFKPTGLLGEQVRG